jgi:hypothetical protein
MAFVQLYKRKGGLLSPRITKTGLFSFREENLSYLAGFKYVSIMIDAEEKKIGIVPTNDHSPNLFTITKQESGTFSFSLKSALKKINVKITKTVEFHSVDKINDMYILDFSEFKTEKNQ